MPDTQYDPHILMRRSSIESDWWRVGGGVGVAPQTSSPSDDKSHMYIQSL